MLLPPVGGWIESDVCTLGSGFVFGALSDVERAIHDALAL